MSTTQGLTESASRAREVRCRTWNEVAISALPPKPNMMPVVCTGRSRPKLVAGQGGVPSGQYKRPATQTPTPMPIIAQISVMTSPKRVGAS